MCLLFVTSVAVFLGIFSASTAVAPSEKFSNQSRIIGALNAGAAVVFTLGCAMSIDIHRSLVGLIRVLWLVALVTSSSGYVYIQELFPDIGFIPNDLAIAATICSIVLLFVSIVVARFCRRQAIQDKRTVLVEMTLAAGALTLRFDEELNRILTVQLGWALWHLSCWISAMTALYILDHPIRTERSQASISEVTVDFTDAEPPPRRHPAVRR